MTDQITPEQRYRYDVPFNRLVNTLVSTMLSGQYTPTDVRDAASLAETMYREHWPQIAQEPDIQKDQL